MPPLITARRRLPAVARLTASVGALGAVLAACGGGSSGTAASDPSGSGGPRTVHVTLTDSGCRPDVSSVHSGPLTFAVANTTATAVDELELKSGERIVGEKENLAPGFSGSFSLNLGAGSYTLSCPGASDPSAPFTVTGAPAPASSDSTSALLRSATTDYARYVNTQVDQLVVTVKPLQSAIDAGKLSAARTAYAAARPFYERIEPVAESFTIGRNSLDADIDARINDVPRSQFRGFHRIELGLFRDHSTTGLRSYAAGLVANVGKLHRLTENLHYQPAELANGAVGLLNEVARTKITGEEERYSHIDVLDFQANVEGAEQAFADLQPALKTIDSSLAATLTTRFATLASLLNRYRDAKALGGFVPYGALTASDKRQLSNALQAVTEPLSQVAAKVVGG